MSAAYESQFNELLEQAAGLPYSPSKVMLLEEAVRLADSHNRVEDGFLARENLIQAATFSGYPEKTLVAFSWCLAQCDRDPENYPDDDILWQYKWVADSLAGFPQITREQIDATMEDITRRYRRAGAGQRAVHELRCKAAIDMGEVEAARRHQKLWQDTPRDWVTDCRACERNALVQYYIFIGKDAKALEEAEPILRGSERCATIPHNTLSHVLLPLARLGRPQEAMTYHRKGYRLVSDNKEFLRAVARHLTFLVVTANLAKATKLFEKHLPWALEAMDLSQRFNFYLAALFLIEQLREGGKDSLKLRLPAAFPGHQESGKYDLANLAKWLEDETRELAARFDERNGNDYFSRRLAERHRLKELVSPVPLQPPKQEDTEPSS
jgi:hypothetical protein